MGIKNCVFKVNGYIGNKKIQEASYNPGIGYIYPHIRLLHGCVFNKNIMPVLMS